MRSSTTLLALAAFALLSSTGFAQSGPPGNYNWIFNPSNGHYYALSNVEGFWQAEAEAVSLGGHLATIRNQQEHDFVRPIAEQVNCSSHHAMIGFTDYAVEGVWEWISGEPVTYANWSPGEPNNLNNNEHYAIYWFGQWGDTSAGGPGSCVRGVIEWFPTYPSLSATGSCPGLMTLTITDATAGRNVAIVYGAAGNFVKSSSPCQGLVLGLASPTLGAILAANSSGVVNISFNAPAALCGKSVQAVDLTTCHATNSIVL